MPRDMRRGEVVKRAMAKRASALERLEFAYPTVPRTAADGPTSFALKAEDPETRRLIDEALAKRKP